MNLDESDPTQCIVYADLTVGAGPLPSGHVFSAGDAKLFFADGTSANAANLPAALTGGATGLFKIQIARAQLQIRGDMLLQIAGTGVDTWSIVIPVDHPQLYGDDSRVGNLTNLDASVSSRATPANVPTATSIATQVDTTLTASHGAGTWQQGNTFTPAPPDVIAAAVWQESRSGNQPAGSFGEYVDAKISAGGGGGAGGTADPSTIAAAVWDQTRGGHQTAGSFGEFVDAAISTAGAGAGSNTVDTSGVVNGVLAGLLRPASSSVPIVGVTSYDMNDVEPPLKLPVPYDGVNDTIVLAASAVLRWKRPDGSVVTVALTIADPVKRIVQHSWGAGELAQVGVHTGEVVITWQGGRVETVQQLYQWTVRAPLA